MALLFCIRSKVLIPLAVLTLGLSMLSCSKPDNQLEDLLRTLDEVVYGGRKASFSKKNGEGDQKANFLVTLTLHLLGSCSDV